MKLCFRSDEPTGGLGHTASRMLVTQLLVLGDLFARTSHQISSYSYSVRRGEAVLSETVLVLDGYLNCGNADR